MRPAANPIADENARPGTADWRLDRPAADREIEGYLSATSVQRGDSIDLHASTRAVRFVVEVFRIGWYGGLGARRVLGPVRLPGRRQPEPPMDPHTGLVECAWAPSLRIVTAADDGTPWPSGIYLARLGADDGARQSYAIFVVRDDGRDADLLFQLPVTTYQAYNAWGGQSLYRWGSTGRLRASKVSFDRPYAANPQNPAAAAGMGAGEFLANLQPHPDAYGPSNAGWDVHLVRWLEREGHDVAYCTGLDLHASPAPLRRCKAWLSGAHDEYWSAPMRHHVEAARDAGTHLAFMGANAAYWQVRFEPGTATGAADRVMVCHKKAARDPLHDHPDPAVRRLVTDRWRSDAVGRPEEALIGAMYAGDPVDGDIVVHDAAHWACAGTGLANGDRLRGLLGYEVDGRHGCGPEGVDVIAASPWAAMRDASKRGVAHTTCYRAASGAVVFATGSIQWAWGLDDPLPWLPLRTSRLCPAAQQITRNVLTRFRGRR